VAIQPSGTVTLLFSDIEGSTRLLQSLGPAYPDVLAQHDRIIRASAAEPMKKRAGRTEFQRGIATRDDDGRFRVVTTGPQGSGVLSSMSEANCFIVLEHARGDIDAGDEIEIVPFDGLI